MLTQNQLEAGRITSHAVGAIIFHVNDDGMVWIMTMPYTKNGHRTIRIPMGTGEVGETVRDTLDREIREEVARDPGNFTINILGDFPVATEFGSDESAPGGIHAKLFFAIETDGDVRDVEMNDGDEFLGVLELREIQSLLENSKNGEKVIRSHRLALGKTLSVLAQLRVIADTYQSFLRDITRGEGVAPDLPQKMREKVKAYIG